MGNRRIIWLDSLRCTATFFVIIIHLVSKSSLFFEPGAAGSYALCYYGALSRGAVPLFAMMSGVLFLAPDKEVTFKSLYRKYIPRIVTAFLFWSVIYQAYRFISLGTAVSFSSALDFLSGVLRGYYHQWYLFVIVGLYAATPLIRKITESKKLCEYFLLISFIVSFIAPFFGLFSKTEIISELISGTGLSLFGTFAFYYVAGHYFYTYEIGRKREGLIYALGGAGLAVMIVISTVLFKSGEGGWPDISKFYQNNLPYTALYAVSIFVFFKQRVSRIKFGEKSAGVISLIAKCSFGIYLSHEIFNIIIRELSVPLDAMTPIVFIPALGIAVFALSFAVSYGISRIPVLNKYII